MNVKQAPKSSPRMRVNYNVSLKIQNYDCDNLYPQNIRAIVAASSTGTTCLNRYCDFIEGNGLKSQRFADFIINHKNETLDSLIRLVARDLGQFGGFALHVNYDIFCRPCSIEHVPFENCRLEETDDAGNVSHICLHPDWTGQTTRHGKKLQINDKTVVRINVFNPDKETIAKEIKDAGGLDQYKGQILYYSADGYMIYPRPIYDSALTDISTDEGLSNVINRNARNNFLPAGIVITYKSRANATDEDPDNPDKPNDGKVDDSDSDTFINNIAQLQGDTNSNKMLVVECEFDEEKPEFINFPVHNYDKEFSVSTETVEDKIYSAFGQEGWLCLRKGKVGFGGDVIHDVEIDYCRRVAKSQRAISQELFKILRFFDPVKLPEALTAESLKIESYSESSNNTENGTD